MAAMQRRTRFARCGSGSYNHNRQVVAKTLPRAEEAETANSRQDREIQNLKEENDRLRGRLALLSELSRRITSTLDLQSVLQEVVDAACELTGAHYGALGVFDDSGRIQQFLTCGISAEEREGIGNIPQGLGLLGWLHQVQQPLRLADLSQHPRSVGFPPNHPPMKTFMGAPIRHWGETLGNIYLTEKAAADEFTPDDENVLVLFATQAAAAIYNARLFSREQAARSQAESAREALTVSQGLLQAVLDNSTAVIYVKDTEGKYITINHRYEILHQVDREAIKGKTDYDIHGSQIADSVTANDKKVLEAGAPLEFEESVMSDGEMRTYISLKFPLEDATGAAYAICGISTDITDRKRMETDIELERQRLEALLHTSPVGVFVADAGGRPLMVNREAARILGLPLASREEVESYVESIVVRRPDGTLYSREEYPTERALHQGETVQAEEIRIELPDGHTVPTLVNASPVYAADGQITSVIAVIQDMTSLEQAEKLRNEFLGMVSHELRTPLTAIKGSAATVLGSRRPFSPEETLELFQIIDEQADRLRDLVDNLLDMTRIEAGTLSVNAEPTDIGSVIEEARITFAHSWSHDVRVDMEHTVPDVKADRRRITQVLTNLLSNAAKFSPPTAPIYIAAEYDAVHVTVHVRDQGRGIPQDKQPLLFKKFSQVHDDSGHRLSGSGLGLAICRGIIEAHGGRIWANSPGEGQGTTVSFTLPVAAESQTPPVPDTTRRAELRGRVSRPGERTRVLAVDDEPQILRYLQRSLDEAGYHTLVTSDPEEVAKLVELEEPDLVLLDLKLPGASGFDLLQRIREFSGVPVIFLTASDQSEDTVRALRMGADDYITKPFSPSELIARIEAALRRRLLSDQLEVKPPFVLDEMTVNFADRQVTVGGQSVALSATEYKLLYELATNAGRVMTHDQLLHRVWGPEYSGETELIRSFIRNLRRKLGDDARQPRYIFTEPQVGYRIPRP